jgi:hypothetical protein
LRLLNHLIKKKKKKNIRLEQTKTKLRSSLQTEGASPLGGRMGAVEATPQVEGSDGTEDVGHVYAMRICQ